MSKANPYYPEHLEFERETLELRAPKIKTRQNKIYWAAKKSLYFFGYHFRTDATLFAMGKETLYDFTPDSNEGEKVFISVYTSVSLHSAN